MTEPILIVGSGALASLFAARLAASGRKVRMLANWPEGLAALRDEGVTLLDEVGAHNYSVLVSNSPAEFVGARLALVLVKSWQTERVAQQLTACLAEDGLALSLQNGLGNYEILAEQLGEERCALGSTTTGASLEAPGRVRAGGEGHILLGEHARIAPLESALAKAGFDVQVDEDFDSVLWGKLAINAAINPLTALLEIPNGELLEFKECLRWMRVLAAEVTAAAEAQGIYLPFDDAFEAAQDVARRTTSNRSSMLQDIQRGAPTEIEAICGAVLRAGERLGVATTANRQMRDWVLAKVAGEALDFDALIRNKLPEEQEALGDDE